MPVHSITTTLCNLLKLKDTVYARSVPSGRVGNAKDAIFRSNEHFREAVTERENTDVMELETRLDRR